MCSTHTQRSHRALGRECCPNYNFVEKVSYAWCGFSLFDSLQLLQLRSTRAQEAPDE